jgi:hypothetical protein
MLSCRSADARSACTYPSPPLPPGVTYSYGLVEVDATAGTTTVTLKDDHAQTIHDQLDPAVACTRVIGP